MKPLTELDSWIELQKHAEHMQFTTIKSLHQQDPTRQQRLTLHAHDIEIDFSNQRINETTRALLHSLANERHLRERMKGLMQGEIVNHTEQRPALHTALRTQTKQPILVKNQDIIPDILKTRDALQNICHNIRSGQWLGRTGKPITAIVNIGIGGSDLGPRFCLNALTEFTTTTLTYHFVSDAEPNAFANAVSTLSPETTLFIISSKSFTTQETLYNAEKAYQWLGGKQHIEQHVIAVTAHINKAKTHGIRHILPIWEWVGGRFSACSAINLITAIAIGFEHFAALLKGANLMDEHFLNTEFDENLPIQLALIGIWNINCLHIPSLIMLTYAQCLEYFVPYIQQLDMESNGKSFDQQGRTVNYSTAPMLWGGLGNQAQHSYYQLLCQGTHKVALELITLGTHQNELIHRVFQKKQTALTQGFIDENQPDRYVPGNTPINHINLRRISPKSLGALIALYEHKIYVQSVIWNINAFDQPGVESVKQVRQVAHIDK